MQASRDLPTPHLPPRLRLIQLLLLLSLLFCDLLGGLAAIVAGAGDIFQWIVAFVCFLVLSLRNFLRRRAPEGRRPMLQRRQILFPLSFLILLRDELHQGRSVQPLPPVLLLYF